MKITLSISFAFLFVSMFAKAQDKSLYKKETFHAVNDSLPYRILLPLNYDKSKNYPLVLMLHGAGE